ncbi:hypothetical protein [Streptomyces arboris]|uniref:hypothetical protein n=1 Tax=Streptomyces arboris TaxID=2600619 RepID=UPI001CEF83B6|nr:hypothetical protein [Streptomyces arboris]
MRALLTPTGSELRLLDSLAAWSRPDTGPDGREIAHILIAHCLHTIGDHVFLHFPGASRRLRLPSRSDWTALVARTGAAVLLLGPEPLPQFAGASQLDTYLETASGADRLLPGLARSR